MFKPSRFVKMKAVFGVLLAILPHQIQGASAFLPSPQNLTMVTLNTQYILRWSWDQQTTGAQQINFTVQYLSFSAFQKRKSWSLVCMTVDTHCDLTNSLNYMGMYMLRIQARGAGKNSAWVQIKFSPDQDADLGPPSTVKVTPGNRLLQVKISDPLTKENISMKARYITRMYYLIQYWIQHSTHAPEYKRLTTSSNVVTLQRLDPWTVYCVSVQSRYDDYNKTSCFSPSHCQQTRGQTPLWQMILVFLISVAVSFLCSFISSYIIFKSYLVIKSTFFPSYLLPDSIQEYLYNFSPNSDPPSWLTSQSEEEICCENLVVSPAIFTSKSATSAPHINLLESAGDAGVFSSED